MKITLKDGSVKEYSEAKSVYDIAADISEGLARVACAGEVDGEVVDLRTVLDKDCNLNIITASDEAFYTLFACGDSLPLQIPVVFFGIKYPDMELIATHPNVCGFTANPDFDVILRQAQKIFPQRKEVVCVIDNSFLSNKGLEDFGEE